MSVNAGSNLLPPESMEVICDVLKQKNTCKNWKHYFGFTGLDRNGHRLIRDNLITHGNLVLGNLERLDLMGNMHLSDAAFPAALEFRKHGKQILIVPSQPGACAPYDDDP